MDSLASFDEYMSYQSGQEAVSIGTLGYPNYAPLGQIKKAAAKQAKPVDATSQEEWANVTRLPSEIDVTMARIRSFCEWQDNWDGEGSTAPSHEVVNSAVELYSLLVNTRLRFRAHLGGSIPMLFIREPNVSGEIIIESEQEVSFTFEKAGVTFEDFCVEFDCKQLPKSLRQALEAVKG
jgi:hypothetical protein